MKKWTKVWGIIAAATLVLGGLLFVIGMSVLDWKFTALDTLTYTEMTKSADDLDIEDIGEIKSFVYNGYNWNLKITKGDEFFIKYYTTEDTKRADAEFDKQTGVLSFDYEEEWNWGIAGFKGLNKFMMDVEVVLPENIDMTINSTNLGLSIGDMDIGNLKIKSTNGDIKLSNLTAGNINVTGTNATFAMTNCTAGDIVTDATNGDTYLTGVTGGKVNCTGTNGDLIASGCTFTSVTVNGTNSDISITSSNVEKLSFTGTNTSVYYRTTAQLEDFASIMVSGTNSSCRINGQKYPGGYTSPSGKITFDLKGTNASARIYTGE